jgi:DNA-binding NarL/FixJ family response regulator
MKKRAAIKVVIADDHAILRSGLRMVLSAQPDMQVVGEAENGDQAIEQVRAKKPGIILLDVSMPGGGGLEVVSEIVRNSPLTRVIVLTMHAEPGYLDSALSAGASGYVLKRSLDSDLIKAIRAVSHGERFVDSGVTSQLVDRVLGGRVPEKSPRDKARDLLSRRELQVLKLVAEGFTNQQIAGRIFVSVKSVETYRARVLSKLHLEDRAQMVRFAIDAGLLQPGAEVPRTK